MTQSMMSNLLVIAQAATPGTGISSALSAHVAWWAGGLIVVIGLLVIGLGDLTRLSVKRIWAISSVSFAESLRRRVLWITPLAILGVIIVAQLQRPVDEQDAIRQTIRTALFATGLLVTVVAIVLASTNLPKEIDTRVIYTVVTKPTTRLEIVVGKVLGFARVSAAILLIMGLFTWGYLHVRAWAMTRAIRQQLQTADLSASRRPALEHYARFGLLRARDLHSADSFQVYATLPGASENDIRWMYSKENYVVVPFMVSVDDLAPGWRKGMPYPQLNPVEIDLYLHGMAAPDWHPAKAAQGSADAQALNDNGGGASTAPSTVAAASPASTVTPPGPAAMGDHRPRVNVSLVDRFMTPLIEPRYLVNALNVPVSADPSQPLRVVVPGRYAISTTGVRPFFVAIMGVTDGSFIGAGPNAVHLVIRPSDGSPPREVQPLSANALAPMIEPTKSGQTPERSLVTQSVATAAGSAVLASQPCQPLFIGRRGRALFEQSGAGDSTSGWSVFSFHGAVPQELIDGKVPFEFRATIRRSGDDASIVSDDVTHLLVCARDRRTGRTSATVEVLPETNRTASFYLPLEWVRSGDFDVAIRDLTPGHFLGLRNDTVAMVANTQSFAFNLFKSLLSLWMLSVLVVCIAVFCSTFLSWPIAIVLTVVILMGRWGVAQVGDTGDIRHSFVQQMFPGASAEGAKVVSSSVSALTQYMNAIAKVLPDIEGYTITTDVEQGVAMPGGELGKAAAVTFGFGIPIIVLGYLFLKFKEVAP